MDNEISRGFGVGAHVIVSICADQYPKYPQRVTKLPFETNRLFRGPKKKINRLLYRLLTGGGAGKDLFSTNGFFFRHSFVMAMEFRIFRIMLL